MPHLLNLTSPIIQAPMAGGATTPELVAAVANAGGLGSLGLGYLTANEIRSTIQTTKTLTNKPFAVNLFIPEKYQATDEQIEQARKTVQAACAELHFNIEKITPPFTPSFDEQLQVLIDEKVAVFSFTFGIPSADWINVCKKNNILLIGTATSLAEATYLEENGIDAIVAQGSEAGGHRGTFLGKAENALIPLHNFIPLLAQHISIPIIAAGGIMNAQGVIQALNLGASLVQMGTAFLCCKEAGIHPDYKKRLLDLTHDQTTLTRAFSGKLARGINNTFITRMETHQQTILNYPLQNTLTSPMRKEAAKQHNTEFMSMWAGQAAYLCHTQSATDLMKTLKDAIYEEAK